MPLFVLVGLFFLQSGRRSHDGHHVHYDTTVACLEGLPSLQTSSSMFSVTTPPARQTAAFVIGRTSCLARASSTDSCATLLFPLAVSDYVRSSVKLDRQSHPNDAVTAVGPCSHLTDSDLLSFHVKALIVRRHRLHPGNRPATSAPKHPASCQRHAQHANTNRLALSAASVLLFVPSFYLAML
ncbi:hypothetical protein BJV77DRAFT_1041548 [Russula vinacea]|nr:hypothetical protein BJV77DRAFT_1041548 [Russula vinacea]